MLPEPRHPSTARATARSNPTQNCHIMDSIQQAQVTMALTVVKTYRDHEAKVNTLPALVRGRDAFTAQLAVVRATASLQETTTEGISSMKKEHTDALALRAFIVAGGLFAYAAEVKDTVLKGKVSFPESDLTYASDVDLGTRTRAVLDLLSALLAAPAVPGHPPLAEFGLTDLVRQTLAANITAFDLVVADPRATINERAAATARLPEEIREMMTLLKERNDPLMRQFTGTPFGDAYEKARNIIEPGTPAKPPVPPAPAPAP